MARTPAASPQPTRPPHPPQPPTSGQRRPSRVQHTPAAFLLLPPLLPPPTPSCPRTRPTLPRCGYPPPAAPDEWDSAVRAFRSLRESLVAAYVDDEQLAVQVRPGASTAAVR